MSLMGLLGLALTVISVLAAYQVGFKAGLTEGRSLGFDDGKRAGSKEGSIRGYAVGFERGRRNPESAAHDIEEGRTGYQRLIAILLIVAAIWAVVSFAGPKENQNVPIPSSESSETWETEE